MSRFLGVFLPPILAALAASPSPAQTADPRRDPAALARDLGHPSFAVREKASKELWKLGPAARPALAAAVRGSDTEARTRAAAILDKFDWGIAPDTPADVVREIRAFRSGDPDARVRAVDELLKIDPAGVTALRLILARDFGDDRRADLFNHLTRRLRAEVPRAIVAGRLDRAEALLELNTLGPSEHGLSDYAVFMRMRGRLAAAADRLEAARAGGGPAAAAAAKGLVFVYRLAGDGAKARAAAGGVKDAEDGNVLVESLLEDLGAWVELADRPADDVQSRVGLAMFRHRLAGNRTREDELVAAAKAAADDEGLHAGEVYEAALGLLLNGRSLDGIELLRARRAQPHLLADVLAARLEFREALDLIGQGQAARAADADADPRLRAFYATRKARLLAQLGRTDDAVQQFNQTAAGIRDRDQYTIQQLLRAEVRAGRYELAAEHAAKFLHQFDQAEQGFYLRPGPFEILFEEDAEAAHGWWQTLRRSGPKEAPGLTMKRVRELLTGKATPARFEEAVRAMRAARPAAQEPGRPGVPPVNPGDSPAPAGRVQLAQALAAAYRAAGKPAEAEAELVRAAEATTGGDEGEDGPAEGGGPRAWVYGTDERFRPWLDLGDFLTDAGRFAEAARRYEEGWKRFPDNPILLYLSGRALARAGDEAEGRRRTDLAHWVPLGNARVRGRFLEELCSRGLLAEAERELALTRQAVWYWERYRGNVWNQIARASVLLKDYTGAAAATERSLHFILRTSGVTFVEGAGYVTVPTGVKVLEARRLLAAGNADEAVRSARACLAVLPGGSDVVTPLVPELDKLGRAADADALFRAVLDVYERQTKEYPRSAWAHNAAAALAANCRRELSAAFAHAKAAVELEPEVRGYKETLAEVHFRRGDREPALALMRDLAKADPRNQLYKRQLARYAKGDVGSPMPVGADD